MNANDYENYTDEELIVRIHDGETEITDYILTKYKNLVMKNVNSMYILGGDNDDLIQEGMIGLFKAIKDYDPGRDASFITFATICVSRQLYTATQNASRKKHIPLNQYISLYINSSTSDEGREVELITELEADSKDIPEVSLMNKEILSQVEKIMDTELSNLEKDVFRLHLAGYDYTAIAKILGRDSKSTDNALQRSKSKIKKAISPLLDK